MPRLTYSIYIYLLALAFTVNSKASTPDYYVNYQQILDNREYKIKVGTPQSIMASRLDFALGFKMDSTQGLYLGLNNMYEYGSELKTVLIHPNIYYYLHKKNLSIYTGSFARNIFQKMPRILFSDSLRYYRPNIEGMALRAHGQGWEQTLMADWTGRRSTTTREAFVLSIAGQVHWKHFYIENYAYMFHNGLRTGKPYGEYIQDNGMGILYLGYDASHRSALDLLKIDLGTVGNYDRERPADYSFYGGVTARAQGWYKRFGIELLAYYGHKLHNPLGNPLYQNGPYARIDLCCIPIQAKGLDSSFKWGLHFSENTMSNSQLFTFTVHF